MKRTGLLVAIMLLAVAISANAGDDGEKAAVKSEQAEFTGTLVCMGCDLKKEDGARSQCGEFGHQHALKTDDGKYISFLENKFSSDLVKGEKYHNQKMQVQGIYFANANQLDVETFVVDGKKKGWCGHCSSMDGCAFSTKGSM